MLAAFWTFDAAHPVATVILINDAGIYLGFIAFVLITVLSR